MYKRIVSEIEESEDERRKWNEIIDILIGEVDACIHLLSK